MNRWCRLGAMVNRELIAPKMTMNKLPGYRLNYTTKESNVDEGHELSNDLNLDKVDEILDPKDGLYSKDVNLLDEHFSVIPSTSFRESLTSTPNPNPNPNTPNPSLTLRTMSDSYLELPLRFGSDREVLKRYESAWGEIKVGRIMEDLDRLAAGIGYKYCDEVVASSRLTIVTASVDRVEIIKRIDPDRDYKLWGHVTYVGFSSMEVFIQMHELNQSQNESNLTEDEAILRAKFTMVARDKFTKKAAQLHPLLVQGQREKELFNYGLASKASKMEAAKRSLDKKPPTPEERLIVHDLYLQSLEYLNRDRVMPPSVRWMDTTHHHSVTVCQPQDRNVHNFIFGGHLMRLAFQLAWVTGYNYLGVRPTFIASDEILFLKSVPIGSILSLTAKVAFARGHPDPHFRVAVHAKVNEQQDGSKITNTFHFTFKAPSDEVKVPRILPKSYEECMEYLGGVRKVGA